jgi:glycosyltransferase involved in cell wall biosynthesis
MKLRLLMISGDREALKPGPLQRRLMQLAERSEQLHVVVPALKHHQQLGPNVWVYGSGGASRVAQWFCTIHLARQIIARHQCNVITAQDPFELGLAAYLARLGTRAKLHLQDHGAFLGNKMFASISGRRGFQSTLGRWLVRRAARVRTVSERGKRGLVEAGVSADRVDVIPIPVDVSALSHLAAERRYDALGTSLLYVGRLEQEKGIDVLIRSLQPGWELTVVGSGSLERELRSLASDRGASVTWVGYQSDLQPYLAAADIAVLPSLSEGWGLAAVEAAASGLPVVMSDVGCAGELLVDGQSALVVPPGDPTALQNALQRLTSDADLRRALGSAAAQATSKLPDATTLFDATAQSYTTCL